MPPRPVLAVVLLALGVGTGLAAVAVHRLWWGLALGVLATLATALALPPGWWSRLAFGAGFAGTLAHVVTGRPEGDYLVSADLRGYALIALGMVVVVLVVGTLPPRSPRHTDPGDTAHVSSENPSRP